MERWKENKNKYDKNYRKQNYKLYQFKIRLDDLETIEHMNNQTNKSDYIYKLIKEDMKKIKKISK